jgi:hypothetical protein
MTPKPEGYPPTAGSDDLDVLADTAIADLIADGPRWLDPRCRAKRPTTGRCLLLNDGHVRHSDGHYEWGGY